MSDARFDGQVAIVTGASRGIGAASAREMAARGAAVMACARTTEACEETRAAIAAGGGQVAARACDIADYTAVSELVDATLATFGRVDMMISNAAMIDPVSMIADSNPSEWARHVTVNLVGQYNTARAVLPAMTAAGGGTIVNVSTMAAVAPRAGVANYCASKAGALMFTRCLHLECGDNGIRVFAFAPGMVDTHMQVRMRETRINDLGDVPREHLQPPGVPARLIAWLCSADADDWRGELVDHADAAVRARAGLEAPARGLVRGVAR